MKNNGIVELPGRTMIFNGGNPLPGCPESYEEANKIADSFNERTPFEAIQWSFDCGFKLDYDGDIVRISSRFHPPKSRYGPKWHGTVAVMFFERDISEKEFEGESLEHLREQVESYAKEIVSKIEIALKTI